MALGFLGDANLRGKEIIRKKVLERKQEHTDTKRKKVPRVPARCRISKMPNRCESGKMDMKSPVRLMVFIGNFKHMLA